MSQATTDVPSVPPPPPPPQATGAFRDLQRAALRDLVALATECATTEAQIERRRVTALAEAERELERSKWAIQQRYKATREAELLKQQERLTQTHSKLQGETETLTASEKKSRYRIAQEYENAEHEVKQKYDQAVWLFESVYEVAQNQIREELKKTKEDLTARMDELSAMEKQALGLMARYAVMPPQVPAPPTPDWTGQDLDAALAAQRDAARRALGHLASLRLPQIFLGAMPWFVAFLGCVLAAAVAQAVTGPIHPPLRWVPIAIGAGAVLVIMSIAGAMLRAAGKKQAVQSYRPVVEALDLARAAAQLQLEAAVKSAQARDAQAGVVRKSEAQAAKDKFSPILAKAAKQRDDRLEAIKAEQAKELSRIGEHRERAGKEVEELNQRIAADLEKRFQKELDLTADRHSSRISEAKQQYEQDRAALERRLVDGLARTQAPIGQNGAALPPWSDPSWTDWKPPRTFAQLVRFGQLQVDLKHIADEVPRQGELKLALPDAFAMPTSLEFPRLASLLIQHDREGRPQALRVLQLVMARLLTLLPAGRVRFTIIDPVGLGQNFAGFMHLADHDEALVGGRIWTEADDIEQHLANLTEHMETVIQKYLRNEFETIDGYNAQAGELAEPYRFLVIADFPVGIQGDSLRRLSSIATSGARCGVYTLIARDTREQLPTGARLDDLEAHSVNLVQQGDRMVWKDEVFANFPLKLDEPPDEESLTRILDVVGRHAKAAKRVEVPFAAIAPTAEQFWTSQSAEELVVPVGRMGATRLQELRLGRGVAQHVLIAGKTGSGKSTLLHVLATNLALWYHPDEVEFYLVDFKKGVEFKTYATHNLPHARAIAVESDREFGLSVLQRLDAELTTRGALFRKTGVQDLASYRAATGAIMPRTLLIIDEFQEFFTEDDKLAQDAAVLLDRLVRQGRAFGIHVLLGSQTLGGAAGLSRSTLGQMAVRVALQCSDADSQLILGDNNSAARLLSRPGEAIYNDAGGLVENNSPFQVSWLNEEQREHHLAEVHRRMAVEKAQGRRREPMIVFEGNVAADIRQNTVLGAVLAQPEWAPPGATPQAWIGDPVAIKDPASVPVRRQAGGNVLLIGQQDESAMAIMSAMMISVAAQQSPSQARFVLLDGTVADSPLAGVFAKVAASLPHEVKSVEYRAVGEAVHELAVEMQRRQTEQEGSWPSVYVVVYGLQRYRALRRQEESFGGFSGSGDEEKAAASDKEFADLLREGPALGMHVWVWADTLATVERTLERNGLREFDNRLLFQMSGADSSNLIDSPNASKLGFHRALAHSEEQGVIDKFRPYALPDKDFLESVKQALARRTKV